MKKDLQHIAYIRGRGAQVNTPNPFLKGHSVNYYDDLPTNEDRLALATSNPATKFIDVYPKTILNKVNSPDIGAAWSMNPYQGCEHGCVYCYARNTHEYWGYSAGRDFEQKILVKRNAAELLDKKLRQKNWKVASIMLAGNTDIYQPIERKLTITRQLLTVFNTHKHPVGIITKNSLIERDIDILKELAKDQLVHVSMSLTTLNQSLKSKLEPRTSSVRKVLRTIQRLSDVNIPVNVMMAPLIPGLNSDEIFNLTKTVASHGAQSINYVMVRLNGRIGEIFTDWVTKNYPDRANKVLHQIQSVHDGTLNESRWGGRMTGKGEIASLIQHEFSIARKKFLPKKPFPKMNKQLFYERREKQLKLF